MIKGEMTATRVRGAVSSAGAGGLSPPFHLSPACQPTDHLFDRPAQLLPYDRDVRIACDNLSSC